MIVIETPRLILRHLTLKDTEALAAIYADPNVMQFFPGTRSRSASFADRQKKLSRK